MARPAARRARRSRGRGLLVLAAAAVAVVVVVAAAAAGEEEVEERHHQQQPAVGSGGTFEFNLPGHGNVKASWRVADDEESGWLDRLAADAESSSSSGSAAGGAGAGGRHRIPFGDDSVKFSSDAYEFIADLLRQGTNDGKGEKPTGYWEKVDEEGSRMLDRIAAANARHRAEANGDDDSIGGFVHSVFSGKSKQHGEEPFHVESDKEFSNMSIPGVDCSAGSWKEAYLLSKKVNLQKPEGLEGSCCQAE
uniref:Uncharacterized protein n=1 Tax=Oryza punctata TaxID=4537 RepID=A0A0E0L1N1_ORYPU